MHTRISQFSNCKNCSTLDCNLLEDIENGFLSTAGQVSDPVLRKQQFQKFGCVWKPSVIVDGTAEIEAAQSVAQSVETSHLKDTSNVIKVSETRDL